ncbi:hypothetical protein [Parasitella parasitica]|uniref:Uncharacterized protein n=1 Tax=Parasitella parasitica TaxID=35722 RepID=A0A0B7NW02_9FUNG|nr:hypothetical protein [Parasitella parasitica]
MERTIQVYSRRIKARNNVDENIGNVLEKVNLQGYIKSLPWSIDEALNLMEPRSYSNKTFIQHNQYDELQLWSPIKESHRVTSLPLGVEQDDILSALQKYCLREPYFLKYKADDIKKMCSPLKKSNQLLGW